MNYAYTRVSTKTQDLENQAYGIKEWCKQHDVKIDIWYEEKISGTKKWENRELNNIMQRLKPGDMIYATEVSRFGRSLVNVLNFFAQVKDKKCSIYCIKENFTLDDSLESQLMQTMYAFVADLSRRLLSQRIKEALQRKKADGIKLGRPFGCKNKHPSLEKHDAEIVN
jgi:DNA invertase Pin-like site-specific DNA recombinase